MTDSLLRPPDRPRPPREDFAPAAGAAAGTGAVVVGVDDGPLPWGLLEHALLLALRRGAALRLVHVHRPDSPRAAWYDDAAIRATAYLTRQAPVVVTRRCATGDRIEALAAAAEPGGVVVLADRHRRIGTAAGTTLDAVIESAPCPVLVVDESAPPPSPDGGVVAGVDGSPDAATVLRSALAAADELATGVQAISTWTALEEAPAAGVEDLVARVGREFPQVPVTLDRVEDRAARRLLTAGREAALLVLGHRHAAATGLRARGSTARTVLAAPPCPMLVLGPRVLDAERGRTEGLRASGRPATRG